MSEAREFTKYDFHLKSPEEKRITVSYLCLFFVSASVS